MPQPISVYSIKKMISAKKIITLVLFLFFIAALGFVLLLCNFEFGKYLIYGSIPIGAVITIISGIAASVGKIENDL